MSERFISTRSDGRSDRQVIYDLAAGWPPGTVFTYAELVDALALGLDTTPTRDRVYRAVAAGNKSLLREQHRFLSVIKNIGYKVLAANEHLPAALVRKDRAQGCMERGLAILHGARLDELNPNERALHEGQLKLHEGQLMLLAEHSGALAYSERRQDRVDELIDALFKRDEARKEMEDNRYLSIANRLDNLEHQS